MLTRDEVCRYGEEEKLVSWCFKPSQPQGITSGLREEEKNTRQFSSLLTRDDVCWYGEEEKNTRQFNSLLTMISQCFGKPVRAVPRQSDFFFLNHTVLLLKRTLNDSSHGGRKERFLVVNTNRLHLSGTFAVFKLPVNG